MSILEDAVAKYAKGDDAYAIKLKEKIRDGMGYSNYMSRISAETAAPAELGDIKGLSPAGIKSRIAARFGDQDRRIGSLQRITGAMDTAAGSLASAQAAREKAAASEKEKAMGLENNVLFQPKDDLDAKILKKVNNPYNINPDGSFGSKKSAQQIEAEINREYGEGMTTKDGYMTGKGPDYSLDDVKKRLAERLPKDYIGNEGKYYFMFKGYSEKQAKENAIMVDYPTMNEYVQDGMKQQYPELATFFDKSNTISKAISEASQTMTDEFGTKPKYSLDEVRKNHSEMTDAEFNKFVLPVYEKDLNDSIADVLAISEEDGTTLDKLLSVVGDKKKSKIDKIKEEPAYKELMDMLWTNYGGSFNNPDLERYVFKYLDSKKQEKIKEAMTQQRLNSIPQRQTETPPSNGGLKGLLSEGRNAYINNPNVTL